MLCLHAVPLLPRRLCSHAPALLCPGPSCPLPPPPRIPRRTPRLGHPHVCRPQGGRRDLQRQAAASQRGGWVPSTHAARAADHRSSHVAPCKRPPPPPPPPSPRAKCTTRLQHRHGPCPCFLPPSLLARGAGVGRAPLAAGDRVWVRARRGLVRQHGAVQGADGRRAGGAAPGRGSSGPLPPLARCGWWLLVVG